jgi:hypothetical protein
MQPNLADSANGQCCSTLKKRSEIPGHAFLRRLTWEKHIKNKNKKHLNLKAKQMHWLLGRRSTLSIGRKMLLYKAVLEHIWTYGVQLWRTALNSNIKFFQRFQSKTLRSILTTGSMKISK